MARRDDSPDFIEAIARGLDVIRAFGPGQPVMSLASVAAASELPRPTARRILLTLEQLGYVRQAGPQSAGRDLACRPAATSSPPGCSTLACRTCSPAACGKSPGRTWRRWSRAPGSPRSIAQLDGSDIVYVARVAVPKIVTLSVTIGTRFPAMQTSLGKVLLAALPLAEAERVLAEPSRSGITTRWQPDAAERAAALREVRARGWALTDEQLAPGIRSVAVPLRDGEGRVIAALNVNSHAAETPLDVLIGRHLPLLLQTAGSISADWAACQGAPQVTVAAGGPAGSGAGCRRVVLTALGAAKILGRRTDVRYADSGPDGKVAMSERWMASERSGTA